MQVARKIPTDDPEVRFAAWSLRSPPRPKPRAQTAAG